MSGASVWEVIFISLSHSTTLMGKLWLVLLVLLRVLVLLLAGFPLYEDEQERFVCNTIQPGCGNVCYDLFAPVSLFRFWLVQLLCLSLPYLLFLVYVVHRVSYGLACAHPPHPPHPPQDAGRGGGVGGVAISRPLWAEPGPWGRCFAGAYLLQLVLRVLLEVGFAAAHYYLFGFAIASRFLCQQPPCTTQVDCYVSRPTEKTVMLGFMLAAAGLSLCVSALDVVAAVKRSVRQSALRRRRRRGRGGAEKLYDEEHYYLVGGGGGGGFGDGGREENTNDAAASLVHQEVGPVAVAGGASRPGSFRKRAAGSKVSSVTGEPCSALPGSPVPTAPGGPPRPRPPGLNNNATDNNGSCGDAPLSEDDAPLGPPPPTEPPATPRSIRVNKRGLKPPPPPRRDHAPSPPPPPTPTRTPMGSFGDVSKATAALGGGGGNWRGGYCGQVAVGGGLDDGQVERSEWV
ncbi:hypothetical protein CRUP_029837 [Coryphaenoides rupestris]|nr:hypothetical protein CRUP_029837 [Coryphaenoides rupestris]